MVNVFNFALGEDVLFSNYLSNYHDLTEVNCVSLTWPRLLVILFFWLRA